MKAMILAAGLGTRLQPLTETTPKPLIVVGGKPLIYYQIALLKHYGITEIAINLHHLGELIEKELGDGRQWGVSITYSHEEQILGTGGGIRKMTPFFGGKEFWVLNADILIDADLKAIARYHRQSEAQATMVLRPYPIDQQKEIQATSFYLNETGQVLKTREAGQLNTDRSPYLFTGLHLIHPSLLENLPTGFSCIFRDAYLPAIQTGKPIFGYNYGGYWIDLGTLERYRQADRDLTTNQTKLSYLKQKKRS